jgi:paraquat-inducible protein B
MARSLSPGKVGVFVVVGVCLLIAGVLAFSSARFFATSARFILYFDQTVTGLDLGAPVKFRGVTIGKVVDILIRYNQAEDDLHMPVVIELDEEKLRAKTDKTVRLADHEAFEELVGRGLRGRLETESLLTGRLYVNLEVVAGADEPQLHQLEHVYDEIPTLPTKIEEFVRKLAQVDLADLVDKVSHVIDKLDAGLNEVHFSDIQSSLTNALQAITGLAQSTEVTNALKSAQLTLDEYRGLAVDVRKQVEPLGKSADQTLAEANKAITELRSGIEDARGLLSARSPLQKDLTQTLDELSRAARSIRQLADFLADHPDSLLTGKKTPSLQP